MKSVYRRLPLFNSSEKTLCTCPPKYNINPYLGRCSHNCVYCYAVKFPSFNGQVKPRLNLSESIKAMVENTHPKLPVMLSDCTDPYQPLEREFNLTRKCLEALVANGFPILIVTKSDLVTRDVEILSQARSVVSMTITTLDEELAKLIEPNAPHPKRRIKALEYLVKKGVTTTARVDPIIPGLNDCEEDFKLLISTLCSVGVKQVTISTLKPVKGFFSRMESVQPSLSVRLREAYINGRWIMGYKYLPQQVRLSMMRKFMPTVKKHGLSFASCREGYPQLNTSVCDGTSFCLSQTELTHYIKNHLG